MERQPHNTDTLTNDELEPATSAEQENKLRPRFWAACLASYNNGILHGEWIDANQHTDHVHHDIQTMLLDSPIPGAEEHAIHDYEQFGPIRLSEYESPETVARLGQGLAEHGEAFGHWAEAVGTSSDQLADFDQHYLGHWDSLANYAEHLIDDLGENTDTIGSTWLRPYIRIDYEALGRDMGYDLHVGTAAAGGVHLFSQP